MTATSIVVGTPAVVVAQAPNKAKEHFARGQELYKAGKYREARAEFSAGYDLSGKPAFLFNMAECSRLSGDRQRAVDTYLQYLKLEPQGSLSGLARTRLIELDYKEPKPAEPAKEASVRPTVPPPADAARNFESKAPQLIPAVAPAPPVPTEDPPIWKHWGFWVAVGVGVAAAGGGAYWYYRDRLSRVSWD